MDTSFIVIIAGGGMAHEINPIITKWFQSRGISKETLEVTGIYSGRHHQSGDSFTVLPDPEGQIAVYPYLQGAEEVNAKFRAAGKKFYQKAGGVKCFWNANVLADPGFKEVSLVITEGEMDALSVIEAGYPYVVSVPDGAPPPVVGIQEDDIDPEHDTKFGYIFHHWKQLQSVRKIIIAADSDDPGRRLAEELVRRLGRVRCLFIDYPEGCKDLNDVLLQHGPERIINVLKDAKPYAIGGIYTYSGLPPEPDFIPLSTGWRRLDPLLKLYFPAFMVVTGVAGAGKSTWVNQLVAQMSILHGVGVAIASFEMRIKPFISEVLINTHKQHGNPMENVYDWLEQNFAFIAPEPGGEPTDNRLGGYGANPEGNFDLEWLLDKAETAVIRHGIRILVIDPWNEIEHAMRRHENHSEYIGKALRSLKRFAQKFDALVILVAHPSKGGAQKAKVKSIGKDTYGNQTEVITNEIELYDVSDSAHFSNKADLGVVVHRVEGSDEATILVRKIRYQPKSGTLGLARLTYNPDTRTFSDWQ